LCDYFGNYLVNWVGVNAVTDIRQKVFDRLLTHDAQFFESHSTGRIMSSVMSDIDKIQMATSSMLADWLRQSFTAIALMYIVLQRDWRLGPRKFDGAADCAGANDSHRQTHPPHHAESARQRGGVKRNPARVDRRTAGGEAFGSEKHESKRFHAAAWKLRNANLRYAAQQAISSPLIEFFGALTIVGLLTYAREQIKPAI
jgi:subfamily B ATP-binding cassette protein MsbA